MLTGKSGVKSLYMTMVKMAFIVDHRHFFFRLLTHETLLDTVAAYKLNMGVGWVDPMDLRSAPRI